MESTIIACVVIRAFLDKPTKEHYRVGSVYESADHERITFLQEQGFLGEELTNAAEADGDKKPSDDGAKGDQVESNGDDPEGEAENELKHVGGGYYELPNGEKVKGKEKALEALAELKTAESEE